MIPYKFKRPLGFGLIFFGGIGIVLGVLGILQIWQARDMVENGLGSVLTTTQETLAVTQNALTTASGTLDTVEGNLAALNNSLRTVAQALNDAVPVLDSFATLMQDELPATLEATQTSLETAEASAKLLDNVMRALTSIPFYPGEPYQPEVPLDVSVQNVATSLEDIPTSLIEIGGQLETNQAHFSDIEDDLISLSVTLTGINTNLANAQTTLTEYQTLLTSIEIQVTLLATNLPGMLSAVAWFLSGLLGWLMLMQVGLVVQGLTLAGVNVFRPEPELVSES